MPKGRLVWIWMEWACRWQDKRKSKCYYINVKQSYFQLRLNGKGLSYNIQVMKSLKFLDGERGAQEALLSGPGEFRAGVQLPRSFVLKVLVLSLPMCSCATLKQTFRLFQPQSSIHIRVSQTTYDRGVNFLNLTFANICLLGLCTCHSHHPLPIIQVSVEMWLP